MVFLNVISRDNGVPWGTTGLTTQGWYNIPCREVRLNELVATQPAILIHALVNGDSSWCGDDVPHVVEHRGVLYLEDGHHRVMRAMLAGRTTIEARVLQCS